MNKRSLIEYAVKAYRDEVFSSIAYSRLARIFRGKPFQNSACLLSISEISRSFLARVSYIFGAFIPLIPYFLGLPISLAIPLSLLFASLMLAITGFFIAVTADLSVKGKILELVVAGLGSALLTYAIGRIASVILGIEVE